MTEVFNQNSDTLMEVVLASLEKGITFYSDSWRAYKNSEKLVLIMKKLITSIILSTPKRKCHAERLYGSLKWHNKKYRGIACHHLDFYLVELMWREQLQGEDPFDAILSAIAPPVIRSLTNK